MYMLHNLSQRIKLSSILNNPTILFFNENEIDAVNYENKIILSAAKIP